MKQVELETLKLVDVATNKAVMVATHALSSVNCGSKARISSSSSRYIYLEILATIDNMLQILFLINCYRNAASSET